MDVPSTVFEVGTVVGGLLPGVVFAGVRTWLRGYSWSDQTTSARLVSAIVVSVLLDSVYLLIGGALLVPLLQDPGQQALKHPSQVGATVFVGVAAVPTVLAFALHFRPVWRRPSWGKFPQWFMLPHRVTAFESTPTAWDKIAPTMTGKWVRVLMPDNRRVAGWVSARSFVSSYPQARDLYIQQQFTIDANGNIGPRVPDTAGVWLSIVDGCIVEWLDEPNANEERQ